jgi:UDP-N-acetylglucosamine 3-dehydrogenase
MTNSLRAGLIGLGMMGKHHARVLATLPGVDFVAISDPAGDMNGLAQGRPVVKSVAELIEVGIDYAVVAVPTIYHLETCLELARFGIHVLVEKPLTPDLTSSLALTNAYAEAGLVGAVGHIERYNPALQEAKRRLEQLGNLYQIVTRRQGPFPARIADVGVVKDLATHDVDLTAWITGKRYDSVSARTTFRTGRKHEDLVVAVGTLEDGTITNHLVNWLSPLKERVTILTGELGSFVVDTLNADLTFFANGTITSQWSEMAQFRGVSEGDVTQYAISKHEPLRMEHENFRDAVLGKSTEIVTMEQGLAAICVAEAMIKSAKTMETEKIAYQ